VRQGGAQTVRKEDEQEEEVKVLRNKSVVMIRVALLLAFVVAAAICLLPASVLAAGDANEAACPNEAMEGFRSYLPDCRAYELVSPHFKDGNRIEEFDAVSEDGSSVITGAVGSFAGVESNVLGAHYQFTRTATGWQTTAIDPPASTFSAVDPKWFVVSANLDDTLWGVRQASESIDVRNLYLREANGNMVEIGPTAPPSAAAGPAAGNSQEFTEFYTFAGASRDLSHVLFEAIDVDQASEPWPGDTTNSGGDSLYEYVGTGHVAPTLVGVSDGTTVVNGKTLAAGELISGCATFLGSPRSGDTYNAVSTDGATVFFTAEGHAASVACEQAPVTAPEVSEVYARLDDVQTVDISEPSPQDCSECLVPSTVAEGRTSAAFVGASEDGSKVFFLTDQELLPGVSGPNLYEYDFDEPEGHKILLVSAGLRPAKVDGVSRVSEDGSHVYFVAEGALTGENREHRVPVEGQPNLYVFDLDAAHPTGRLAFIATLSSRDSKDWSQQDARPVQVTPEGRFAVFQSSADLTPGDTSTLPQVFEYDALDEQLVRVSVGQPEYPQGMENANDHASEIDIQQLSESSFRPVSAATELAISDDGTEVLFHSTAALSANAEVAAAAGAESVYEYRSTGGMIDNGRVYLMSDGQNALTPQGDPVSLDPSGTDAFFLSVDPLVPQDSDLQFDLYDARSGGGFPAPAQPPSCAGEGCLGSTASQPQFASAVSTSVPGEAGVPHNVTGMPVITPKPKPLTRQQLLSRALKTCRHERAKKQRARCEARARQQFHVKSTTKPRRRGATA
jgi:hypothetical protein